ncbi:hypothetical protein ABH931_004646 [Streptacidiphilus sp. MAP12-33]|uniref:hypothetical protein n=1 Tax=Streptacidiphilus sp. MAP12-33 TaxID=3156266 RepID=UPI0035175079
MLAWTGTWDLLRAIGERAVRGLAAVEPSGVRRQAQRNAGWAAAEVSARRREVQQVEAWIASRAAGGPGEAADTQLPPGA